MRCQLRASWPGRFTRPIGGRTGRRRAAAAPGVGMHLLAPRPSTVTVLRRFDAHVRHTERLVAPRISVSVTVPRTPLRGAGDRREPWLPGRRSPAPGTSAGAARRIPDRAVRTAARPLRAPEPPHRAGPTPVPQVPGAPRTASTRFTGRVPGRAGAVAAVGATVLSPAAGAAPAPVVPGSTAGPPDPRGGRSGPAATAGPPDVERLTDKVVAALDRRLWSRRERMGGR